MLHNCLCPVLYAHLLRIKLRRLQNKSGDGNFTVATFILNAGYSPVTWYICIRFPQVSLNTAALVIPMFVGSMVNSMPRMPIRLYLIT